MRPFDDDFTIEKMDKQLEEAALPSSALPIEQRNSSNRWLLQDIQRFYQHDEEDTSSLDRVLNRLLESGVPANESIPVQKEGRDLMHPINTPPTPKRENKHRTLALIAATLFVALLVGSMVTLFTMARQGQIAQTNNTSQTGGAQKSTSTPLPPPTQNIYTADNDTLYKLDGKTHEILWKYRVPLTDPVQETAFMDNPVVSDGKVFITTYNGDIHALDSTTGKRIWVAQEGVFTGFIVADGLVVFKKFDAGPSGNIYTICALNASDGKLIEPALKMSTPNSEPYFAVANKIIYIGLENSIFAMNILNGESIWETTIAEDEHVNGITIDNDTLYFNTIQTDIPVVGVSVMVGNIKGYFEYGYTLDKPQQKWRHQLDLPLDVQITQPVWAEDSIQYYSWRGQHILAWKADEGRKLWSFEGGSIMHVADGVVYAAEFSEPANVNVIALNANTGKVLWKKQILSLIDYIRTCNGKLYILVHEEATNLTLYEMSTKDDLFIRKHLISDRNGMAGKLTIAP